MTRINSVAGETSKQPRKLNVFVCYGPVDKEQAFELARKLRTDQIEPWLEDEQVLPGQVRKQEIRRAISSADVVIVCLSKAATSKTNFISELQYVQEIVAEQPEHSRLVIPARLEECEIPSQLDGLRWVDLYRIGGYQRLLTSLQNRASQIVPQQSKEERRLSHYFRWVPRKLRSVRALLVTIFTVLAAIVGFGADTLSILNQLYQQVSNPPRPTALRSTPTTGEQEQYMEVYTTAMTTWPIQFQEDFSADRGIWFNGDFSDNAWTVKKHMILDGKYRTVASPVSDSKGWMPAAIAAPGPEYYVAVDAQLVNGSYYFNEYGLIFAYKNGQDFLSFVIGDDGEFRFSIHNSDYSITDVVDWTQTEAIVPGQANRLAVIARDTEFLFYINDQFVSSASIPRNAFGKVGLIILSSNSDERVVFEFDNFELRTPG